MLVVHRQILKQRHSDSLKLKREQIKSDGERRPSSLKESQGAERREEEGETSLAWRKRSCDVQFS